jgi:hypothetical protein
MAAFHKDQLTAQIELLKAAPVVGDMEFDPSLEVEVQTDKDRVKLVPCRECKRPLTVTTFFAPKKAICRTCTGESGGQVGVPQPGKTDPADAVNLADCLINKGFAFAVCPIDAEGHGEMKLIHVGHNPNYGPREIVGYEKGVPVYAQRMGETAMLQCQHRECNATVNYSTTSIMKFKPQNAPKTKTGDGGNKWWADLLGVEDPVELVDAA